MSETHSTAADIALDLKKNTASLPSPGEVLRLNRENSGLSLDDVAKELNVTAAKVSSLEADEFQKMHSEPFTRGYLRSYAKLLKIDAESLIACYEEFAGSKQPSDHASAVSTGIKGDEKPSGGGGKLLFIVPLLVASVWFVIEASNNSNEPAQVAPVEPSSAEVKLAVGLDTETAMGDTPTVGSAVVADIASEKIAAESIAQVDSASQPQEQAQSQIVTEFNLDRLDFTFTDESWVEVTDSANDVLFADVKQAGEQLNLEGVAPFNVMLGNARATQLRLNGESVVSEPESGRDTLKFTVPAAR